MRCAESKWIVNVLWESCFMLKLLPDLPFLSDCWVCSQGLRFLHFPYLLTLQLKRFDFDYTTMHRIKLNDRMTFPEELDMSPFIDVEDEVTEALTHSCLDSNGVFYLLLAVYHHMLSLIPVVLFQAFIAATICCCFHLAFSKWKS